MRYLWLITLSMVLCGAVLALGSLIMGLGPAALVCGTLLVWSGIVKAIVLGIWRNMLDTRPAAPFGRDRTASSQPSRARS